MAFAESFSRLIERLSLASARNPWATLIVALLIAAACGAYAAQNLRVNTNSSEMLSQSLDFRQRALELNTAFPGLQNRLIVVVRAPDADTADAFTARLAERIRARPQALADPFAGAIEPFFQRNGLIYMEDAELDDTLARITRAAPLIGSLAAEPSARTYFASLAAGLRDADKIAGGEEALTAALSETAATIEARLAGRPQPLAWSRLFAAGDGPTVQRVLSVDPRLDFSRLQPARPAVDALRAAVAEARADPRFHAVEAGITGEPALRNEELGSVVQGLGASAVASLILIGALIAFAFRSLRRAAVVASVMVVAIAVAAAFGAAVFESFNLVSVGFSVLLVGMGADYASHTLLRGDEALAKGEDGLTAAREAMDELVLPLGICAICTGLGFMAFVPTPFVGMAQLGVLGAVGVLTAFLCSVTVVPAGIALLPRPRPALDLAGLRHLAPVARPLTLLLLAASALALLAVPFARFDADPMNLRDPGAPSVAAYEQLFANAETQPYRASVLAPDLAAAERIAAQAKALPVVENAITAANLVPGDEALYRRDAIEAAAFGILPQIESAEPPAGGLAELRAELGARPGPEAQRLATALARLAARPDLLPAVERDIFEWWPMRLQQLKSQLQPDPEITLESLPAPLRERFLNAEGQARIEIAPAADLRNPKARSAFVDSLSAAIPAATGPVFTVERSGEVIGRAMLVAFLGTLAAVTGVLLLLSRDLTMTLATLFPVLAAAALTTAFGVLAGIPFNFANVIALPLMIGAGIDSAIHYASRARVEASVAAVAETSTPRAILVSALTTIASSGSLMLSPHRGVASIGILLTVALSAMVLTTLLLQPLAIRLAERRRKNAATAAATAG